jgi:hypothetical protein
MYEHHLNLCFGDKNDYCGPIAIITKKRISTNVQSGEKDGGKRLSVLTRES